MEGYPIQSTPPCPGVHPFGNEHKLRESLPPPAWYRTIGVCSFSLLFSSLTYFLRGFVLIGVLPLGIEEGDATTLPGCICIPDQCSHALYPRVSHRALGTCPINSDEHDAEHGVRSVRDQPLATERSGRKRSDEPKASPAQQYNVKSAAR